ncbi:MAG: glycogen synthase [Armatimonadetes bacterium]|nr:glycogen synthase [Armatimonadota bacterium]
MKIACIASEVDPFAKTGGLADVAAALPRALPQLGHDVRIIMPLYRQVDRKTCDLHPMHLGVAVAFGPRVMTAQLWQGMLPKTKIPTYFIDCPLLFDRDGLYQVQGKDFPDNLERFSLFSQAALRALPLVNWRPDVVHCHDWQSALAVVHLKHGAIAREPFFSGLPTVLTIHNLAYQGLFLKEQWWLTQLPESLFGIDGLEFYGQINCLKGGLVSADQLTTVSPTYAREIQTNAFGCGLEGVLGLRAGDLRGILNGIDSEEWNPSTDPHLAAAYSADSPQRKVTQRLADQKGIDIVVQAMETLMQLPVQIVILGTGDPAYHRQFEVLAKRFPEKLAVNLTFNNALAHQIEAGADAFLMPSRFEPCGLNQMYSMRYGTVPIVKRVGGLADTVTDANGFIFEDHTAEALVAAITQTLVAFANPARWRQLMQTGMRADFSWTRSASDYLRVYQQAITKTKATARG